MPMQFAMLMATNRSKCEQDLKVRYWGCRFFETGSSNNSAVDWHISSKFGMQVGVDFDILTRVLSLNPEPEVDVRRHGRNVENSIWRPNSAVRWPN